MLHCTRLRGKKCGPRIGVRALGRSMVLRLWNCPWKTELTELSQEYIMLEESAGRKANFRFHKMSGVEIDWHTWRVSASLKFAAVNVLQYICSCCCCFSLKLVSVVGEGEFGVVMKANAHYITASAQWSTVAVKMLRSASYQCELLLYSVYCTDSVACYITLAPF